MNAKSITVPQILLGLFFVVAGTLHFLRPSFYVTIMPRSLPHPLGLVYLSGFFEILGGFGVFVPRARAAAGWGLIALLLCVFPANIKMFNDHLPEGWSVMTVGLFFRLLLQPVFIWVVYRLTRVKYS